MPLLNCPCKCLLFMGTWLCTLCYGVLLCSIQVYFFVCLCDFRSCFSMLLVVYKVLPMWSVRESSGLLDLVLAPSF